MADDEQRAQEDPHEPVPNKKSWPSTVVLYSRKNVIKSSNDNIILYKEVNRNQGVFLEAVGRDDISDLFESW